MSEVCVVIAVAVMVVKMSEYGDAGGGGGGGVLLTCRLYLTEAGLLDSTDKTNTFMLEHQPSEIFCQ
jgi:hypothetical protein